MAGKQKKKSKPKPDPKLDPKSGESGPDSFDCLYRFPTFAELKERLSVKPNPTPKK